jgi:SAM-dependent methyltransferase
MEKKGNKIENWDSSYQHLPTTYSEKHDTPSNMSNIIGYEFVHEDIQRYLGTRENLKILEIGCGGARTSVYLAKRGYDTTCTDNSPEAIRLALANFDSAGVHAHVLLDDLFNSKLEKKFYDCIMSFGLLEHFEDLTPLVTALNAFLSPGGLHIHVVIPKKFSTQTIMNGMLFPFRLFKNIVSCRFDRIIIRSFRDFPHYENSYSAQQYCKAFEEGGNKILRCEAGGILFPFYNLSFGVGHRLIKAFGKQIYSITKYLDRSESKVAHMFSPTFYIIAKRQEY